jgi:hypothetical protein
MWTAQVQGQVKFGNDKLGDRPSGRDRPTPHGGPIRPRASPRFSVPRRGTYPVEGSDKDGLGDWGQGFVWLYLSNNRAGALTSNGPKRTLDTAPALSLARRSGWM